MPVEYAEFFFRNGRGGTREVRFSNGSTAGKIEDSPAARLQMLEQLSVAGWRVTAVSLVQSPGLSVTEFSHLLERDKA